MTLIRTHIEAFRFGLLDRLPRQLTADDVRRLTEIAQEQTKLWPPGKLPALATVNLMKLVDTIEDDRLFFASNYLIQFWHDLSYASLSVAGKYRMLGIMRSLSDDDRDNMCREFFPEIDR